MESNPIHWLHSLSDWLDSLIGPGGLLLLVLHLFCSCSFMTFMDVVGKKGE